MDDFQTFTLAQYLQNQSTNFKSSLPLVHSSESYRLLSILGTSKISVNQCDTFRAENLAYFFHGRPSYRKYHDNPQEWQLPFVLILESACLLNIRRIFPFDTGSFFSKRLPSYITVFDSEGFELSETPHAIDLLIDIFFGSDDDYLHNRVKSLDEVHGRSRLNIRHAEITALCTMYNSNELKADDRAQTIEIQSEHDVMIKDHILGVVMPRPYFDDKKLKKSLRAQNIIAKPYDVYNINTEAYMIKIYEEVKGIYKKLGMISA